MLVAIEGVVVDKSPSKVVLFVGGLGYEVNISTKTYDDLPPAGDTIALHLHTHVREDTLALFGFANLVDKETFLSLLQVPKIGPKLALAVLGHFDTPTLINTILAEDTPALKKCAGVGQKTAELIIVQLRDKMQAQSKTITADASAKPTAKGQKGDAKTLAKIDAMSALTNLGYKPREVDAIIDEACQLADQHTAEGIIRGALRLLQK